MRVIIEVPDEEVKNCGLCGRLFDKDDYGKTMTEQTEGMRLDCDKWFHATKYCGLFCAWLSQPDMVNSLQVKGSYESVYQKRKYNNIVKMRDYIAKRVAEYLLKETRQDLPRDNRAGSEMVAREKRFFITKNNTVRWVKQFITKNISWDSGKTHLVVSMNNNLNEANRATDCKVESADVNDFFETERDAQLEIFRRERFEKK